ncbi:MAG: cupin domain-containing protein [Roseovarius sp.]|jgi:transcriptional regulator with XRE-family HTH domain
MSNSLGAEPANDVSESGENVLGMRLRQRRKVKAMSLKEVADIAEVSVGLLSQIERSLAMPSVRSLGAICGALDMPVAWLFDGPTAAESNPFVIRRSRRRVLDLGGKGMVKELMTPDSSTGIQMMRIIIRPNGSTGDVPYNHPQGAKCGTVLSGVLGLEINHQTYIIETGDSFAFEATQLIRFWCEGDQETEVLWVVSPALY